MTATDWNWLLAIIGTIASIAGVVFSWLAWVQAGNAKNAAREAVNAIRLRNMAHNFSQWAADARELHKAVRDLDFENAQRAGIDLLGVLSHNHGKQKGLGTNVPGLADVVRKLNFANTFLIDEGIFFENRLSLTKDCMEIYRKLSVLAGQTEAKAEE